MQALYKKVNRTEPQVLRALVRSAYARLAPVRSALGRVAPVCEGMAVRIVDGNDLPASEKRLLPLRGFRGAAMPGQSLVVYDPDLDLVADVLPWEDAHAHERSLLQHLAPDLRGGRAGHHLGSDEVVGLAVVAVGRERDGRGLGDVAHVDARGTHLAERLRIHPALQQHVLEPVVVLEEVVGP